LRAERYDAILDLQEQLKGAIVARMAIGRRHGFDRANVREPIATWLDDVHHPIDRNQHFIAKARALAAAALGYTVDGRPRWNLRAAPGSRAMPDGPYALAFHSTSRKDKLWPEQDWIGLLAHFAQAGFRVLLPWGMSRSASAASGWRARPRMRSSPPRQTLPELATLARSAEIVVGVDTGLTHLAAALGTPTVAIFTTTDATLAGVTAAGTHAVDVGGNGNAPSLPEVVESAGRVLRDAPRC
jgi:heptosyltransferase-1